MFWLTIIFPSNHLVYDCYDKVDKSWGWWKLRLHSNAFKSIMWASDIVWYLHWEFKAADEINTCAINELNEKGIGLAISATSVRATLYFINWTSHCCVKYRRTIEFAFNRLCKNNFNTGRVEKYYPTFQPV